MKAPPIVALESPAKINLGLEILGKRPDGYHEIRTVMARVDVFDTLTVGPQGALDRTGCELPGIERNLVDTALNRFLERVPGAPPLDWSLEKRIPVAAGLGGASSNAASALVAANALCGDRLARSELAGIAATIGSDVPFFLGAPVAVASGRGTDLLPIAAPALDVLLVVPDLAIAGKTARLYSLLEPGDFGDGEIVSETARLLAAGRTPDRDHLGNAFCRALRSLDPRVATLQGELDGRGVAWALSGAGPAHYVVVDPAGAVGVVDRLREVFGNWLTFVQTRTCASESPAG